MAKAKQEYEVLRTFSYDDEEGEHVTVNQNPRPEVNGKATVELTADEAKGLLAIKAIKASKKRKK